MPMRRIKCTVRSCKDKTGRDNLSPPGRQLDSNSLESEDGQSCLHMDERIQHAWMWSERCIVLML